MHEFSGSVPGNGKGTFENLVVIARNQGWKQLFSGLSINYLKVIDDNDDDDDDDDDDG